MRATDLPPLRKTVTIEFWSLRNDIGPGLGVIFDVDTLVTREAYRTRTTEADWECAGSWKWQIRGLRKLARYDQYAETDQEILDEYGSGIEFEIIEGEICGGCCCVSVNMKACAKCGQRLCYETCLAGNPPVCYACDEEDMT